MKTIKYTIIIIIFILSSSCSKSDDTPVIRGFFPTQIQKTDYSDSNRNRTYTIAYNSQNQITEITEIAVTGESLTKTFTYSSGLLMNISVSNNINSETTTYEYIYNSSALLTSIIETNNTATYSYAVSYDSTSNSYSLNDSGIVMTLFLDDENSPIEFELSPTLSFTIITDNESSGAFKNVKNQIAIQLTYNFIEGINFCFFHHKQINNIDFGTTNLNVINSRDSNNNIRTVNYNNTTTGQTVYGYVITYSERNL